MEPSWGRVGCFGSHPGNTLAMRGPLEGCLGPSLTLMAHLRAIWRQPEAFFSAARQLQRERITSAEHGGSQERMDDIRRRSIENHVKGSGVSGPRGQRRVLEKMNTASPGAEPSSTRVGGEGEEEGGRKRWANAEARAGAVRGGSDLLRCLPSDDAEAAHSSPPSSPSRSPTTLKKCRMFLCRPVNTLSANKNSGRQLTRAPTPADDL